MVTPVSAKTTTAPVKKQAAQTASKPVQLKQVAVEKKKPEIKKKTAAPAQTVSKLEKKIKGVSDKGKKTTSAAAKSAANKRRK